MRIPRYRFGARWYDTLSLEWLLYRRPRRTAISLLAPRPGDRVLDVGCGTGLSLAELAAAVGPTGEVVGIDASAQMLALARRRVAGHAWGQVQLVHADAARLGELHDAPFHRPFDAVLFCYSLSIVPRWHEVWQAALDRLAPGGRVAVVDTDYPRGRHRLFAPLAWLLLAAGGVRPGRRVWAAVARDTVDVEQRSMVGGHVRLAVGTVPSVGEGRRDGR